MAIFGDNKTFWYLVVSFNNFASMSNCPLVHFKNLKEFCLNRHISCKQLRYHCDAFFFKSHFNEIIPNTFEPDNMHGLLWKKP